MSDDCWYACSLALLVERWCMARRVRSSDQSPLRDKLEALPRLWGLRRRDLAVQLGSGLRRLWGIEIDDSYDAVYKKVVSELEEIFLKLPSLRDQTIARLAFNIEPEEVRHMTKLEDRWKWLNDLPKQPMHNASTELGSVSQSTQRRHLDKSIFPLLERSFQAAWDRRFPREPFPDESAEVAAAPAQVALVEANARLPWRRSKWAIVPAVLTLMAAGVVAFVAMRDQPEGSAPGPDPNLQAVILGISDVGFGWSVAFPTDKPDAIKAFIARAESGEPIDPFFGRPGNTHFLDEALDAGGYVLGGALIQIQLEGPAGKQLTIYNIRTVATEAQAPVPSGAAILFPVGGDSIPELAFDLDQAHPIAKTIPHDGTTSQPFFQSQVINLKVGEKRTLMLAVGAKAYAYTFNVVIDYEVGGQKYSHVVTRSGQESGPPFRVTGSLCPTGKDSLTPGDRAKLQTASYGAIRSLAIVDGVVDHFAIISQTTYTQNCRF